MTLPSTREQARQLSRWREFPAYIITFDPVGTPLEATNVQAALTELALSSGGGGGGGDVLQVQVFS